LVAFISFISDLVFLHYPFPLFGLGWAGRSAYLVDLLLVFLPFLPPPPFLDRLNHGDLPQQTNEVFFVFFTKQTLIRPLMHPYSRQNAGLIVLSSNQYAYTGLWYRLDCGMKNYYYYYYSIVVTIEKVLHLRVFGIGGMAPQQSGCV